MKKYQLFVILVVTLLLINGLMLPDRLSSRQYLSGDAGSALLASSMMRDGIVPYQDFTYNYGFATLWLNRLWFDLFGHTPLANLSLNILWSILLCWAIAEMIEVMNWSMPITWLVLLSMPYVFCFLWFTTAHILEPALIILCMVRYLKRFFASALLLATLAILVKPSLAYFAELYLVIAMLTSSEGASMSQHLRRFVWNIVPSLVLLLAYSAYVLSKWGLQVYLNSLVPLTGMSAYQESSYGFITRGRLFWFPATDTLGQLLEHYLLTPAGAWIAGTLLLTWCTFKTIIQWPKTRLLSTQQRCILICGMLHFAFIVVLFGNEWSWTYTTYLVVFGVAACLSLRLTLSSMVVPAYAVIVLLSLTSTIRTTAEDWRSTTMRANMNYLFFSDSMHRQLSQLCTLAEKHRVLMLGKMGAPSLILKGIEGVPTWYYLKAIATKQEQMAMLQLVDQADVVVIPNPNFSIADMQTTFPEINDHLKRFTVHRRTDHLFFYTNEKIGGLIPSGG